VCNSHKKLFFDKQRIFEWIRSGPLDARMQEVEEKGCLDEKTLQNDIICPFSFNVFYCPVRGFYIKCHSGHSCHCYHSRQSAICQSVPGKLLTSDQKKMNKSMTMSGVSVTSIVKTMEDVDGTPISAGVVRFQQQLMMGVDSTKSEADVLLQSLMDGRNDHIVLTQSPQDGLKITKHLGTTALSDYACSSPEMEEYLRLRRKELSLRSDQEVLLAIFWVTPMEKKMFARFPYVVKIDTTFGTNNRKLPLLTMTGKTNENTVYTIARCWIPNEQQWILNWVMEEAMSILDTSHTRRNRCVITDGDSTEIASVKLGITKYFPNAKRIRCAWHIVDRSWDRLVYHIPKSAGRSRFGKYESARKSLKDWVYSLCQDRCESVNEFTLSKTMLERFLESQKVLEVLGIPIREAVLKLWWPAVKKCLDEIAFYERMLVDASFEEYTNLSHEASYSSTKNGYAATRRPPRII